MQTGRQIAADLRQNNENPITRGNHSEEVIPFSNHLVTYRNVKGPLTTGGFIMAQSSGASVIIPRSSQQHLYLLLPKAGVLEEEFERWIVEKSFPDVQ